jgi:hypothetical protein
MNRLIRVGIAMKRKKPMRIKSRLRVFMKTTEGKPQRSANTSHRAEPKDSQSSQSTALN